MWLTFCSITIHSDKLKKEINQSLTVATSEWKNNRGSEYELLSSQQWHRTFNEGQCD